MRLILICWLLTSGIAQAEERQVTLAFRYRGTPPELRLADLIGQGYCGDPNASDPRLSLQEKDNAIGELVVRLDSASARWTHAKRPASVMMATIRDCQFEPHVVQVRAGGTLMVSNRDTVGHMLVPHLIGNDLDAVNLAPGRDVFLDIQEPEPVPGRMGCRLFEWMGLVIVADSDGRSAITPESGKLVLEVPSDASELSIELWHQLLATDRVWVNGDEVVAEKRVIRIPIDQDRVNIEMKLRSRREEKDDEQD